MDLRRLAPYQGLLLALVVAAVLQAILVVRSPSVTADGIIFMNIAKDMSHQPVQTVRRQDQHPAYPAVLLAVTRGVQALGYQHDPESWIIAGQIIGCLCGLLSVWIVWLMAREFFDVQVANVAAMIFAVLPVPRANAADAMSDTPHTCIYLLAAWLASSAFATGNSRRLAAAAAVSGLAYWIRPEGLEVAMVILLCVAIQAARMQWPVRRALVAGCAVAAATLAVAGPYWLLSGKLTSKQLPGVTARIESFVTKMGLAGANPAAPQPQSPPPAPQVVATPAPAAAAPVAPAPAAPPVATPPQVAAPPIAAPQPASAPEPPPAVSAVKLVVKGISAFINSICQGFKFVFIPFYLLGTATLVRRHQFTFAITFVAILGVLHISLLVVLHMTAGYIAHRHVLPVVGLAMPFAAYGVVVFAGWLANRLHARPSLVTAGTLAAAAAMVLPYTLRPFCREFEPVIAATRWVQTHAAPGTGIVCNSPYVDFYGTLPVAELGLKAPTIDAALSQAPAPAQYDYVILHVGAYQYQPQWIADAQRNYHQVLALPDPTCLPSHPRKVLVFQSNRLQARHTAKPQS